MPRIGRLINNGQETVYHVISRTALDGFPLGDVEKEHFVSLIRRLSALYFVEVMGFCVMGNHFHLLVKMIPGNQFSDDELKRRYQAFYHGERDLADGQLTFWRNKLASLSEYVKDLKQRFSRFYNNRHNRRGFFWGERFKSLIVEKGETLINCLAYIDLNPVRAGIAERPEDYRWSSISHHVQAGNKDNLLSLDFGLSEFGVMGEAKRLRLYRRYLYEAGGIATGRGTMIDEEIVASEDKTDFESSTIRRFRYRTRHFTDAGIIGTREFVRSQYLMFKDFFTAKREKVPKKISGLNGIYALKRLSD